MNDSGLPSALQSAGPVLYRRMITSSLRRWRDEAGLTQAEAARRLDRTVSHISNIETDRLPPTSDLELLLTMYGKQDRIQYMRELLSAAKRTKNWWTSPSGAVPGWFGLYLGLESGAAGLSSFDSTVVPSLLQTRDYAEAVLRGDPALTDEQVQESLEVRMRRQQILDRVDNPLHLGVVLDESVLYRIRGDAETMRAQFEHLLTMSERPRIDIQVLPFDAGSTPVKNGGTFTLMTFPPEMEHDPGLVYVEMLTSATYLERPEDLGEYQRVLDRLRTLAADPKTSRQLIERAMKK
ncbi:helix-turn-helix domain-containing protein [Actinokineospora sp.]|uniref:helix-turn-helix domain-containing protein n=1 Tax=Actinokineospora sp. TaxID=1872133 RepID=UPI004037BF84